MAVNAKEFDAALAQTLFSVATNEARPELTGVHMMFAAVDGKAGLDAFRHAHEEGKPFDLICLDIMMPQLDGQGVLRAIRAFEEEKNIDRKKAARVIMTTALGDKLNVIEALPRCDAYLQKPIDRKELLFYIKKFGLLSPAEQQEILERERKRAATAGLPEKTKDMPWVD